MNKIITFRRLSLSKSLMTYSSLLNFNKNVTVCSYLQHRNLNQCDILSHKFKSSSILVINSNFELNKRFNSLNRKSQESNKNDGLELKNIKVPDNNAKLKQTNETNKEEDSVINSTMQEKPEGLIQRFKKMYKEYWYILIPVHLVTSAFWFGSFYYVSQSGVDIPAIMETVGFSDKYINPLRDSKLGHVAVAYLLYKVATPLRYTVTIGGTTISIKYLVKTGKIKPMPSKEQLIQKYKDHRDAKKS